MREKPFSAILYAQSLCCSDLVLELGIDLVETDVGGAAGGEPTIWVEGDSRGRQIAEGRFDAGDNRVGGVDLAGLAAHTAQANLNVLGKLLEDGHIASAGRGELHRDVADLKPTKLLEDRVVAAAV